MVHHGERPEPSAAVDEKLRDLMRALTLHDGGLNYINGDKQGNASGGRADGGDAHFVTDAFFSDRRQVP